ncbi:MAG: Mur ligase family protein [Candidatus Kerfeldbacteria bacterium]|nr:Mur ligase family protein [Candidatus Kerfeldbacteria bacterium]
MQSQVTHETRLECTRHFFARRGNPQNRFRVIHVAGTAGKGSTASLIAHMLHAQGYSAGLITSPFVTTTLEDVWINGKLCDPNIFIRVANDILDDVEKMNDTEIPSYSETLYAIGVECCAQAGVEWLVTEVGCGGKFDYTNIFSQPTTCVLTPIGLDHMNILGNTVPEIAAHKAGIIHTGCTVFSAQQSEDVRAVFDHEAALYGLTVHYIAPSQENNSDMPGAHQSHNSALACAVVESLGVSLQAQQLGMQRAFLPARCEVMQRNPLVIIDGAHSVIKMRALAEYVSTLTYNRLFVIYSAKYSKDPLENLTPLLSKISTLWCTEFHLPGFSSHSTEEMKYAIAQRASSLEIIEEKNPLAALHSALARANANDCILVTGSLYMAGIVREHYYPEKTIVLQQSLKPAVG